MAYLKTAGKAVISIGLLSYLVYISDPRKILQVFSNISTAKGIFFLIMAVLLGIVSILLMSIRWRIILNHYNNSFTLKRLFGFYLIGLFFNNFLPTSIGGDMVRIYKVVGESNDRTAGFASVIIERVLGIVATLFLAITSLYYVSHYFKTDRILYTSVSLLLIIISFFILITRQRPFEFLLRVFDKFTIFKIGEKINKLMEAIHILKEKRRIFIWMFVLSVLSQVAIVFMNYAVVIALDIKVDLIYLFLVVPITFLLTMLPSINGVGIRDGGFIFLLGKVGIPGAAAISLSFMNVILPMFISLWGGILFFVQKKKSKPVEVQIEKTHI